MVVPAYLRIVHLFFWEWFHWPCLWCHCFRGIRESIQWLILPLDQSLKFSLPWMWNTKTGELELLQRNPTDIPFTLTTGVQNLLLSPTDRCPHPIHVTDFCFFLVCSLLLIIGTVLRSFCFCLWDRVSLCSPIPRWTRICYVDQAHPEHTEICLRMTPKCWNWRHVPSHPAYNVLCTLS